MALAPIPLISALPEPPIRSTDTGAAFSNKLGPFLEAVHGDFQPELNATATAINDLLPAIEAGADAADEAAASALAASGSASAASSSAGTAATQAGIATTQAGIATTQAGLAATAKADAETARDVAIGAGPLPSQSGNSGKFLTTDGTSASWDAVRWTQHAITTTGSVGQWDFTSIPQTYADLMFRITMTPASSGSFQIALDHGSGFGTAVALSTNGTVAQKGGIFIPNYTQESGVIIGGIRAGNTADVGANGTNFLVYAGGGGISGIRLSLSSGNASSVSIQLFRR